LKEESLGQKETENLNLSREEMEEEILRRGRNEGKENCVKKRLVGEKVSEE
jgi:hypothetical protein